MEGCGLKKKKVRRGKYISVKKIANLGETKKKSKKLPSFRYSTRVEGMASEKITIEIQTQIVLLFFDGP